MNPREKSWKESIRAVATTVTQDLGIPHVAKSVGIVPERLRQFVVKGYLGTDDVKKLEEWFIENGHIEIVEDDENFVVPVEDPRYIEYLRQELVLDQNHLESRPDVFKRAGCTFEDFKKWLKRKATLTPIALGVISSAVTIRRSMTRDKRFLLPEEHWLEWQELVKRDVKSPSHILAGELRSLADFIASPDVPKEIKSERFVSAVRGWNATIKKYAALLKK